MAPKRKQVDHESESSMTESALPSPSNPLETFNALQAAAESNTIHEHVPQILELMGAVESSATPLIMRVRFLEFIARYLSKISEGLALKKIVVSLVKLVSGDDTEEPLACAAIRCFECLGPVSTTDSNLEYLAREAVDILLQVTLDHGAFEFPVRKAAVVALDHLTDSAFRCVVTKLIHWISDDREDDDEEQLKKERQTALSRLLKLSLAPSMKKHWTEEMQTYTLSLIQRVLKVVDAREFTHLMRIASSLPMVKSKDGIPLLEMFVAENTNLTEQGAEALAIIGRHVKDSAEFDLSSFLENAGVFQGNMPSEGDAAVFFARAVLLAAKVSPPSTGGPLVAFVFRQLSAVIGDGSSVTCDFSVLEALLLSVVFLSKKNGSEVLSKLNEDHFTTAIAGLSKSLGSLDQYAIFAVKKMVQNKEGSAAEAELLACLSNCKNISACLSEKRIPSSAIHESWSGRAKLPMVKRGREEGPTDKKLPPHPGSSSHGNDQQRQRSHRTDKSGAQRRRRR